MRKIISTVCGIFILSLTVENINFVCAQNEIIENTQTDGVTNGLTVEELPNDLEIQDGENSRSSTILRGAPALGIPQTIQTIDTSDYGIIRIKDPNNTGKGITMLDRNLGATATGAGVDESRQSFGYYFQRGNNFGFSSDPNVEIPTASDQVDASEYGPNTENGYYSSDTFIIGNNNWNSVHNDNLWGGSGDSRDGNGRGYPVTNPKDRRGPCPENYHVPSIGEWSKLLEFRSSEYGEVFLDLEDIGLYRFYNNPTAVDKFNERFNIPMAGLRANNSLMDYQNELSYFWSSSPHSPTAAFRLYGNGESLFSTYIHPHSYALPIRCFYDSYRLPVKIRYNINGGYRVDDETIQQKTITYTKGDDNSEYSGDMALGKVKKNNNCGENNGEYCMFGGWYTLTGNNLWTGNIVEDITLYASRLSYRDKTFYLSGVAFNIIDRNLGAETSGIDENAYGYYLTGGEEDIVCPEGYHIPSTGEWLGIKSLFGLNFSGYLIKNMLDLPFAGKMENGIIMDSGKNGYYLSKNGDETKYVKISNSDVEIENLNEGEKVSVRCFKDYNVGIIKFYSNGGGNVENMETVNRREEGENLGTPIKDNSIFLGWYNQDDKKIEKNINYKNEEEISLYAKWECEQGYQEKGNKCEKIPKQSGGSNGGGGRGSRQNSIISNNGKNSTGGQTGSLQDSSADKLYSQIQIYSNLYLSMGNEDYSFPLIEKNTALAGRTGQSDYPQEFIDAYNFAYKNLITTKSSIYDSKIYSPLTRIQMAKMLSYFAINVLGKKPDISKGVIKFDDVSNKLNKEYGNAVTLSYQLGIMGQNVKNNKFRPHDEVNRAELATALSRLLYGTKDGYGKAKFYEPHLIKLYNEGIINTVKRDLNEKKGYLLIMLMRYMYS